jgi:sec-independent protein translocase protein TatA
MDEDPMTNPMIGMPQGAEWLVILAIVILVFGAAKLPDLARGTGQALRIFKSETKGLKDDDDEESTPTTPETRGELPASPSDEAPTTQERRTDNHNG